MKMLRDSEFRVQSSNKHLKNILEEGYYIELGCVNYKVLSRLLSGEEILIQECVYNDLAQEGIGQISKTLEDGLMYQLSYLMHLRQKSSSCKIFLTCNIIKYFDKQNRELYAPVVLIPIVVDYQNEKIIKSSEVLPNKQLLNELSALTNEEITYPDHLNTLSQIDNFSFDLAKKTGFDLQIGNFLTYANVEYPDFKGSEELFDIERSIYELTPKEITTEYYDTVKGVLPTNIQQKYVILKASKGESFAVDGRLGSGKTYTILNIVADKVAKGKKVLYVNQDNDSIDSFERELYKHHMGEYTHNFERIYPIDYQTEILLKEVKNENTDIVIPQEIFDYEEAINDKCHGITYKQMTETIAYLNNKYESLELFPIEASLEHFEIKKVYDCLKKIEKNLKHIDELKNNIWSTIEDYFNRQHRIELINAVTEYKNAQLEFNKYFIEFCTRYSIINPNNFNEARRLVSDVRTFSLTMVPPKWSNGRVYQEAKAALEELSKDIADLHVLNRNYEKIVIPEYCKGDAEDILDTILYTHLKERADTYVNQLLSPFAPLESIINNLRNERKAINYASKELKEILEVRELPNDIYSFLKKLEHLLSHTNVNSKWIQMYVSNKTEHVNVNRTLENLIITSQELHADILQYVTKPEFFRYENLKVIASNGNFEKTISKNFDRRVMRANKKSSDRLYQSILEFMDMVSEIGKVANKYSLLEGMKMEDFADAYRSWIDFIENSTPTEYEYLVSIVEKNNIYYLLKNNTLLNIASDFNERCENIQTSFDHIAMYGISIKGEGILEQINNVDEWIDYLKRVIKCKELLYKIFIKNASITYKDVLELINMDREHYELFKKTEIKGDTYYNLLGDTYQGLYTDCNAISVLMEHFEAFQEKLENRKYITSLLSTYGFTQMVEEYNNLETLSERVSAAHRQFSRFFKGGQAYLLECDLNECVRIIRQYELKTNQLTSIFEILESLRYFDKLGLYSIVSRIKNSEYTTLLAERYIYSTYQIYRNELMEKHPILKNSKSIIEYFEQAKDIELDYCLNNIGNLITSTPLLDKKNKDRRIVVSHFNEYNKIMENECKNRSIFLANVDIFNSNILLSSFDTIIVDDCHIASSNKYHRIEEAAQVLLFGDKSFRTSVSNSLLNRINPGTVVHYNRRYYPINDNFKNDWKTNNQYIYNFQNNIKVEKIANIKHLVELIVHYYNQNSKPDLKINIVVFNINTRRQIYTELVNKLLESLPSKEVVKLLSTKFNIINGQIEDAGYADEAIIFFDDLRESEASYQELVLRNFSCVSGSVSIVYLDNKDEILNKEIEAAIKNLVAVKEKDIKETDIVTELIIDKMQEKGVEASVGFGLFNLVIKGNDKPNVGIIIEGTNKENSYYLLDDYEFYYDQYIKNGWNVFVFFMDDIIDNLDKRINEVLSIVDKTTADSTQLSFIDGASENDEK